VVKNILPKLQHLWICMV